MLGVNRSNISLISLMYYWQWNEGENAALSATSDVCGQPINSILFLLFLYNNVYELQNELKNETQFNGMDFSVNPRPSLHTTKPSTVCLAHSINYWRYEHSILMAYWRGTWLLMQLPSCWGKLSCSCKICITYNNRYKLLRATFLGQSTHAHPSILPNQAQYVSLIPSTTEDMSILFWWRIGVEPDF
jgi:hypothetical protein